ncbi:hypothetical protein EII12_09350 [Buchananella hordeovulneris]|uniref:TetR/AcrR family transcriptional regulator n=1 Tax=Buchananella hordeovulneris TaxID=52770 RepID=UPI000F5F7ECA|nr:hypothetical protein [Buchananella hordeovulneris]RRD50493.1 hypothetical protein EII12_09350 [Buchananella hordeovulneris]
MERNPELTKIALLEAGFRVLGRHYVDSSESVMVLPISATEVVRETANGEKGRPELTAGAIKSAFGGKAELLRAIAQHYMESLDVMAAYEPVVNDLEAEARNAEFVELAAGLAKKDLRLNLIPEKQRHFWQMHAHAAHPEISKILKDVYEKFDDVLMPLYRNWGERAGLSEDEVKLRAAAITAMVEGLSLRVLSDDSFSVDKADKVLDFVSSLFWGGQNTGE